MILSAKASFATERSMKGKNLAMLKLIQRDRTADSADGDRIEKQEELDLIDRAKRGDRGAGRRLVDLHKQRLHTFIWRIVRDTDMAEEVCQETFLRAFRALASFKSEYRFSTWLFTIGYRLALNQMRARSHRKDVVADLSNAPAVREQQTPQERVLQSEQATQLRQIIWQEVDRLNPVQKASLLMFYREGLSCKDIADSLGMPVATVKSHMHRARQRLRVRLERLGVDDQDLMYLGA